MSACKTVRIKPTELIQCPGHDFVEINESDFDENIHELYEQDDGEKLTSAQIKEKLTAAKIDFSSNAKKPELEALLASIPPAQ